MEIGMQDRTRHYPSGNGTGARGHFAIVPHDTDELPFLCRAIWVGVGGTLVVALPEGGAQTYINVPDGSRLDVDAIRVLATGTTCTNLIGQY